MNGASALIRTLVGCGVDVCFANPGTSEMHFVAALDEVTTMRGVLCLFEGVATGAADGYARVTGRPAATLLHLGPGLGNGLANLHNARRAHSPLVNIVGDHATYHHRLDAPLESDIESLARPVSGWYRSSARADDVAADAADAVAAALGPPGRVATLVLPADVSWSASSGSAGPPRPPARAASVDPATVEEIAKTLRAEGRSVLVLGGRATTERGLRAASRVANATGARLLGETFPARLERGAGRPELQRIGYYGQPGLEPEDRRVVLVDAHRPVAFFAYPDQVGDFVPDGCDVHVLADGHHDAAAALEALADAVGAGEDDYSVAPARRPARPTGTLNAVSLADALGAVLPEGAVVVDEANTAGVLLPAATAGAPPHLWLTLTGGAIGQGMPAATGAALGAPGAKVVNLQADGSAMYTFQALWTQAREGLDVTTVVLANRSYAILNLELARVGASGADRAARMLELTPPDIDFVSLAAGLGVPASRATTADELVDQLERALASSGPQVIEAVLPPGLG